MASSNALKNTAAALLFAMALPGHSARAETSAGETTGWSAVAVYAERTADGNVRIEHEADRPMAIASFAKLMTGILVARHFEPGDRLIVSPYAISRLGRMGGFVEGEEIDVEHALALTLIESSNDGATALAEYMAAKLGWIDDGIETDPTEPEMRFVEMMNREADAMGLKHTRFANPHGLDAEGGHSTARDAARLFKAYIRHPLLLKFAGMRTYECTSVDGTVQHRARNTNRMLDPEEGILAGKTGTTRQAGEHLVVLWQPDKPYSRHVIVVLGSTNRYTDMRAIIEHLQSAGPAPPSRHRSKHRTGLYPRKGR